MKTHQKGEKESHLCIPPPPTFLKKIFSGVLFYCVWTNQNLACSHSLWGTVRVGASPAPRPRPPLVPQGACSLANKNKDQNNRGSQETQLNYRCCLGFSFLMPHWFPPWNATLLIHTVDSASGQNEAYPVFLLATLVGTMVARDILRWSRKKKLSFWPYMKSFIQLTTRIQSRWLDVGLALFCVFIDLDNAKKKKAHSQYPAMLTEYAWSIMYIEILMVFRVFFFSFKEIVLCSFLPTWMSSDNLLSSLPTSPWYSFPTLHSSSTIVGAYFLVPLACISIPLSALSLIECW